MRSHRLETEIRPSPRTITCGLVRCVACPDWAAVNLTLKSGRVARLCGACFRKYSQQRASVYVFRAGDRAKIGFSTNVPARLKACQTGSPLPLSVWRVFEGGRELERELHERFADEREHGEWFRVSDRLRDFVEPAA